MQSSNFTVYKSSAGSGKTFTLVKEYLTLALSDATNPPQAYKHILAITFTNKAAAEMKDRIIKTLKEFTAEDYSKISQGAISMLVELKKNNSSLADEKTIRIRSQNILSSILHNYSDFAIGTIDAFVYKVVRTFAFDLKIPMSFEIEMDGTKLLSESIDLLIAKVGHDEQLTKALVEFTENKTDDEKNWHIENDLLDFSKNLLNDEGTIHIDKLRDLKIDDFLKIKIELQKWLRHFEKRINKIGSDGLNIIKLANVEHSSFAGGENGIGKYFTYLVQLRTDKLLPSNTVQNNVSEHKWYSGKATKEDKLAIDEIKTELEELFNEAIGFVEEIKNEYFLFQLINRNIYSLSVLNEIEKMMQEYKTENNILHISEFNKLISKIVSSEPIPFIYERLGERYTNYLFDEFQDTSVMQFQNLLPLIDNALSNGNFTMLVGDGKQAIYRFRGGEVEQFALLPEVFKKNENILIEEREDALKRNYSEKFLDKNFRSKKEVIEFNNSFYAAVSSHLNEKYQIIYKNVKQEFNNRNTGGFVSIDFIEGKKPEFYESNKIEVLKIIKQLIEDNYSLKDIAILVRKNSDGSELANFLTKNNTAVLSSDSLLLSQSAEVNFLFSLLKFIGRGNNNIVQAEIINYLVSKQNITNTTIEGALMRIKEEGFYTYLKSTNIFLNTIQLAKLALYELCEELIRIFNLDIKLDAYIQFFLDEVLNYSLKKNNNLNDFVDYWEEQKNKSSLVIPQGLNAITILTIHKSKGLEFPVVIIPFANSSVREGKQNAWIDLENEKIPSLPSAIVPINKNLKQTQFDYLYDEEQNKSLLDMMNLVYVATTRAEERLYVLTGKQKQKVDKITSITDMFSYFIESEGMGDQTNSNYVFGTKIKHKEKLKKEEMLHVELEKFNSNNWRDNIKIKGASKDIWDLEVQSKMQYGILVHAAFSKIKTGTDVESVLNLMCTEGIVSSTEKENLSKIIFSIIKHPKLEKYFAKGLTLKNEVEIITANGSVYRPDRIIIENNSATIIDYKTGEEKQKHKEQINEYANLICEMGYSVNEKLLVYVEEEKVVEC